MPEDNNDLPRDDSPHDISPESAQRTLASLSADRTNLAERAPQPKWLHIAVGLAMAAIVATPAFTEPGENHSLVACLAVFVITLQHVATRRSGVRRPNTTAKDVALTILLAIVLMGMLSVSLGMNASGLALYWTALPVAITFGATIGTSMLIDRVGRERIRDGQ